MAFLYAYDDFILRCHRASGRNHVLKTFGAALLLASSLAIIAGPALALQTVVTQTDKNPDGSVTYHFALKTDPGETLTPGDSKAARGFRDRLQFLWLGRRVGESAGRMGVLFRDIRPNPGNGRIPAGTAAGRAGYT